MKLRLVIDCDDECAGDGVARMDAREAAAVAELFRTSRGFRDVSDCFMLLRREGEDSSLELDRWLKTIWSHSPLSRGDMKWCECCAKALVQATLGGRGRRRPGALAQKASHQLQIVSGQTMDCKLVFLHASSNLRTPPPDAGCAPNCFGGPSSSRTRCTGCPHWEGPSPTWASTPGTL